MGLLKRDQAVKLVEQNRPRWFLLSYDAGKEVRETKMNEKKEEVEVKYRKYATDDFRKIIIRTLLKAKVEQMDEPAETAIYFLDPSNNVPVRKKLDYWESLFDQYEEDFYYIITPSHQDSRGLPFYRQRPNQELQRNFQILLGQVQKEEEKKQKRF